MWAQSSFHIGVSINLPDTYYIKQPIILLGLFGFRLNKQEMVWSRLEEEHGSLTQLLKGADLEHTCLFAVKQNEAN